MLTDYVLLIHDGNCLCFIICDSYVLRVNLYWADRLLHELLTENFIYMKLLCSVLYGHIDEKQELPFCYQYVCVEILVEMKVLSEEMGRCIVEGSSDSMCLCIFLRCSTGSMSGDNILVVAASP